MTDKLRAAAQALIDRWDTPNWKDARHTGEYINALRAALADDQLRDATEMIGEPVAWVGWTDEHGYTLWDTKDEAGWMSASDFDPIPVPSPRREWKGLTDEELTELYMTTMHEIAFARAIEAALRNKNGGGE